MKKSFIYPAVVVLTTTLSLIPFNSSSLFSTTTANTKVEVETVEERQEDTSETDAKKEAEEKAEKERAEKEKEEAKEAEEKKAQEKEKAEKEAKEKAEKEESEKKTVSSAFPAQSVSNSVIEPNGLHDVFVFAEQPENEDFRNASIYMLNTGETDANKVLSANCGVKYNDNDVKVNKQTKYTFGLSEREINAAIDQLKYKRIESKNYGIALRVVESNGMYLFEMIEIYE